jgi:DNA-binding transcriptional regulator of glucitol operon
VHEPERPRRGALIALLAVVFFGCLALGWWQWERFASGSGGFQSLGYALQWPLFAVFAIYAYRRFVVLEARTQDGTVLEGPVTELPAGMLPERPLVARGSDGELSDYNAYLAALAAQDSRSDR